MKILICWKVFLSNKISEKFLEINLPVSGFLALLLFLLCYFEGFFFFFFFHKADSLLLKFLFLLLIISLFCTFVAAHFYCAVREIIYWREVETWLLESRKS